MSVFRQYADYYNLIYKDKDYAAEANFVTSVLHRFTDRVENVIELGCGSGGHALHLARQGVNVTAVDASADMLQIFEHSLKHAEADVRKRIGMKQDDIRNPGSNRSFDAVVSLFHVFSYMASDADLAAAMKRAADSLRPGGVLIFDCWHGPAVMAERPEIRERTFEDENLSVRRTSTPIMDEDRHTVEVVFDVEVVDKRTGDRETFSESHLMRYLFQEEIEQAMVKAGLRPVESREWMSDRLPSEQSWNVYHVAVKP